ncbi:prolyl oligopeptidase family serine peptidase [Xanthomonas campestris pv. campestris]|uniref:carboxylesterase family protein n=1 Tax=Xanthomonas campestris TaxID=339 RepID=UPI001E37A200|nr:prolyl oligopeptidase family serine peptidase [Xanthomonas campestris]MCD0254860.1 prolyl oligopeptidase family serine peptidase [Xanthomonas campestris pv. campestris]MEB1900062.1 prolyl oligopeptidase family serine peptidase [Xanthomonas campestris pv. campestris]WVL70329.1 prolyl oligopeptidase family serine peptidase [Xanthomonas campestris pv. campestris]
MRRYLLLVVLALLLAGCSSLVDRHQDTRRGHFVTRSLEIEGRHYQYQVFVPVGTSPQPRPIVLFLHGSGERGDNGRNQAEVGVGPYLSEHTADFPALVVLPQVPDDEEWLGINARMAIAALDATIAEFSADPQRTYLTGISMGGYGAWEIGLMQPQRFAAIVPICGALKAPRDERRTLYVSLVAQEADPYAAAVTRLKHVPIWMFHGAKDEAVPPHDDRALYRAAKGVGANVRYSEYPNGNHNAWDATYADPAMWEWMFKQRLR